MKTPLTKPLSPGGSNVKGKWVKKNQRPRMQPRRIGTVNQARSRNLSKARPYAPMTRLMKSPVHSSIRARLCPALRSPRMRAHISGVRVNEITPEDKIETMIVTENSRKIRPSKPGKKTKGRKTAASSKVIDKMVKEISPALLNVAFRIDSPCSARRTTFSRKTIASSTKNPMARVSAIKVKLLME